MTTDTTLGLREGLFTPTQELRKTIETSQKPFFGVQNRSIQVALWLENDHFGCLSTRMVFKSIEKSGGWITSLKEGTIQRKIKESADKELAQFNKAEKTLVGTNKYQNPEDKMKADLEKSPFLQKNERKTLLKPIIQKRLAEKSEQERLKKE